MWGTEEDKTIKLRRKKNKCGKEKILSLLPLSIGTYFCVDI